MAKVLNAKKERLECQRRSVRENNKRNCRAYSLNLSKSTDGDIIAVLDELGARGERQGYIKSLIRADINRQIKEGV